jgi:hypothetical protein
MASIINATTAGLQETGDPNSQGVLDLQANGSSVVTLSSTTGARFSGNLYDNGIEVGVHAQAAFNAANNSASSVQSAYTTANNAAATASNAYTAANVGSIFVTTGGTVSGNVSFANNVTVTQNLTIKNFTETLYSTNTSSSITIDLNNGTVQTTILTASSACTFTMPTATAGKSFVLLLKQAATTGGGTATFTGVKWGTSGAPTITTTAGKMDILTFIADGTNWYGSIAQGYTP